jgi:hypothetical protein
MREAIHDSRYECFLVMLYMRFQPTKLGTRDTADANTICLVSTEYTAQGENAMDT